MCLSANKLYLPKNCKTFALFGCFALVLILYSISNAERLPIKTYTVADGLLRDNVSKIKQDSSGFLWFCTSEGISRFDGAGMTNFTVSDGLPNRTIEDFLETKSGTIYIATGKGLARLNPQGARASTENPLFTTFLPENPKAEKIQTLFEDKNRQVWVGTSDGLYKLIETSGDVRFELVPLGEPLKLGGVETTTLFINTILADSRGTLWIGTDGSGLFRLVADGGVRRLSVADGLGGNQIAALLENRAGQLWASMQNGDSGGLCLLDAETSGNPVKQCYSSQDGLPSHWISDLLETSDGKFWLATVAGLCQWQGEGSASVCKTYAVKNDLCVELHSLVEDTDGNLWTGSLCGATKIARYGFMTYSETDGLDPGSFNSIFENSKGELFVSSLGKNGRTVNRFDGDKFSSAIPQLPKTDYYGWGWQQTVWQDGAGAWWIPTKGGFCRSPNNTSFENLARATLEKIETGIKQSEVFRLFEDSRGDIWLVIAGSVVELRRWERATGIWHNYSTQSGFSLYRIGSAFVEDRHGNIWIGASSDQHDSALIRYHNGEFRVFTEAEGAPTGWIRDLFLDSRGRLWIASTNDGLWRLDKPDSDDFEFVKYTPANGLTSVATASITEDEFGRIYVGTWRGVDRLNPDTGHIENFTTADGLPASFVDNAYRDRQNNLWFGTPKGLARFVPEPPRTRQPPTILITGLRVEGESQNVSILGETEIPRLDLSSEKRQISVDFLGLGATLGEKLKYEYRFGNSDWTQTTEHTVNFANLASGDYLMEVRAQTADGIFSQKSAIVSFKIATPFWQKWWFVASILILTVLAGYLFYKNRLARMLEIERMRTRIATDLHDDIGANLTKISVLSEVVNRKLSIGANNFDSGKLLENIAETSRESVSAMSDIVWAINPKKDSLADLTIRMRRHAEEILERCEIRLEFDAPPVVPDLNLNANLRRNIYLIFKESLTNIVRHSYATKVEIDFRLENGKLILTIADNGRGFDKAEDFDGNGLLNMKKRAAELRGNLQIDSAENEGATVVLVLNRSELRLQT